MTVQEVIAIAHQTARGDEELDAYDVVFIGVERAHLSFAAGERIDHGAGKFLGNFDVDSFKGLLCDAIDLFDDDLRFGDRKFIVSRRIASMRTAR